MSIGLANYIWGKASLVSILWRNFIDLRCSCKQVAVYSQLYTSYFSNWRICVLCFVFIGSLHDSDILDLYLHPWSWFFNRCWSKFTNTCLALCPTQVDLWGYKRWLFVLEWMGVHALGIFILLTSNILVIFLQGFYWKSPENNLVSINRVPTLGK